MGTIFSKIVDGEIPAHVVYEDETTLAFLDVNPLARGHTLVIPKAQYPRLTDVPPEEAADLYATVHRVVGAVQRAVDADGATVGFNDGAAAGQEVEHVHCHVVPRHVGDGGGPLHDVMGQVADVPDEEFDGIAEEIAAEL